jgi:hypothetical protein
LDTGADAAQIAGDRKIGRGLGAAHENPRSLDLERKRLVAVFAGESV